MPLHFSVLRSHIHFPSYFCIIIYRTFKEQFFSLPLTDYAWNTEQRRGARKKVGSGMETDGMHEELRRYHTERTSTVSGFHSTTGASQASHVLPARNVMSMKLVCSMAIRVKIGYPLFASHSGDAVKRGSRVGPLFAILVMICQRNEAAATCTGF